MIDLGAIVSGCLAVGFLFAAAGQTLALGVSHDLTFWQSLKHAAWLAVVVLVVLKAAGLLA